MIEEAKEDRPASAWHLDKKIPIALIATIFIQTGAAIWWASGVSAYIETDRLINVAVSARVTAVEQANNLIGNRLTRLETLLESQADLLREIRDELKAR